MSRKKVPAPSQSSQTELCNGTDSVHKSLKKRPLPSRTSDNAHCVSRLNVREGWAFAQGLKAEKLTWLLENRVPKGNITLLDARKGSGKSSVLASIAAAYSRGKTILGKSVPGATGNVLWLQHEESYSGAVVPRFRQYGGDDTKLIYPKSLSSINSIRLPSCIDSLAKLIADSGVGLAILDPFSAVKDAGTSQNDQDAMRVYLEHLKAATCDLGATVLMSRHLRKGTSGSAVDQGIGSVAIAAVARCVMRIDANPLDDGRKLLSVVATNAGPFPFPLEFLLEDTGEQFPRLSWQSELEMSIEEILEGGKEKEVIDESKDAASLLSAALKDGPKPCSVLIGESKSAGVGERTLRKAKTLLGITSERKTSAESGETQWYWSLPTT